MGKQWIVAAALFVAGTLGGPAANAATIFMSGEFGIEYLGTGDPGDSYDPPLQGILRFDVRSPQYNPNDSEPGALWPTLNFEFTFLGETWDENDVPYCECYYTGERLSGILFENSFGPGSWLLAFNYDDGNFGMSFYIDGIEGGGTSEDGIAGVYYGGLTDFRIPEPGTFALLLLGLVPIVASRRRLGRPVK